MWSAIGSYLGKWCPEGRWTPHIYSHPPQPADQVAAVELEPPASRWSERVRKHLRDGLALKVDIGSGVAHRRIQTRMP